MTEITGPGREAVCRFLHHFAAPDPYVTAHTSGSTGRPKQILLDKNDMLKSARATVSFFNLGRDALFGLPLSMDYIAGKMQALRALVTNATLWAETPSSTPLATYSGNRKLSLLPVVPMQLPYLLDSGRIRLARCLLIGGAPLHPAMERRLLDEGVDAWVSYGMTETCSHVALRKIGSEVYEALPGISFRTTADGRLSIMASGFSFAGKTGLQTNDVARVISPARMVWLGRADNAINTGGVKVHPEQIEHRIADLLEPRDFFITGSPDLRLGQAVTLVVETEEDARNLSDRLEPQLRERLGKYEMPRRILTAKTFLRTASGKVIRRIP